MVLLANLRGMFASTLVFAMGTLACCWVIGDVDHFIPPLHSSHVHTFADWTTKYVFISIGFFFCTIATTLYRFGFVKQSIEQTYLILAHLSINIQGLYAYYCVYKSQFAYIDPWGMAVAPSVFTLWCFSGGGLSYMMLIDRMDVPLNKVDSTVVFTLYISILCGTLAVRTHYFAALTTISWIFLVMCLYYVAVSISDRETDTLVGKAKVQNIYLYFVLTLLFGLATILVNFKYVSNDELMVFLALMDAFTKGILTVLNLDCQLVRLLALESQFLIELEANKRRRQFMKYMFHEVRNPLNTIAMGMDYFSTLDQSGWSKNFVFKSVLHSVAELEGALDTFLLIQQMDENTFELSLSSTKMSSLVNEVVQSFPQRHDHFIEIHIDYAHSILGSLNGVNYSVDIANIQFIVSRMLSNAVSLCGGRREEAVQLTVGFASGEALSKKDIHNGRKNIQIDVTSIAAIDIENTLDSFFATYASLPTVDPSGRGYNSMINFICKRIAEHHGGYMTCELSDNKKFIVQTLVFQCDPIEMMNSARPKMDVATTHISDSVPSLRCESPGLVYSPTTDAKRFMLGSASSSPVVTTVAVSSYVLNDTDLLSLGTSKSKYRTKVALIALCKLNKIPVKSNFSKEDIIQMLRNAKSVIVQCDAAAHAMSPSTLPSVSPTPTSSLHVISSASKLSPKDTISEKSERIDYTDMKFESLKTLVVDDSEMNRKMLQRMLKIFDVSSDVAEDGKQAVEMVKSKGPSYYDIIFMDYTMPVMNGVDATWIIRGELLCNCKIIAVTGNAMEADVKAFIEAGANRVILKPIRHAVLKEELLSVLSTT